MEEPAHSAAWLESVRGEQTPVRGTCFIGRTRSNGVVLPDERVSRRHAMVHAQGHDEFWIIDLGSSNGTYLNGRRISQPCQLNDQDRIEIAEFAFVFRNPKLPQNKQSDLSAEKTIQDIKSLDCWLLLADIESSTQIAKSLPADEAPRVTGRWLAACKQIVDDNGGAINKFLGDGFFAYWIEKDNRAPAVARALEALKKLQDDEPLRFRVVLHFGPVFVGGGASLGEESLLGNEVNFAFRMEKVAASAGAVRLLSERARGRLTGILVTIEGFRKPVPSFDGEFAFFTY